MKQTSKRPFGNHKRLAAALLIAVLSMSCRPSCAQSFGYWPGTGGSSWLYAARSIFYPFSRYGGSGYAAASYLAYPLVRGASYYTTVGLQKQYGNVYNAEIYGLPRTRQQPMVWNTYQDGEPIPNQSQGQAPKQPQTQQAQFPPAVPYQQASAGSGQPVFHVPPYGPKQAEQFPPLAPAISNNVFGAAQSPMVDGFVDLVNRKYEGNISKALFDPQARNFARAIGLVGADDVFNADLSEDRIQLIKSILADPREDSMTKVTTVRMLLKH